MTGASQLTHPRSRTSSSVDQADFVLTLWTDDPALARHADLAGIERVGLDLERLGKRARQRGLGTWISSHAVHRLPEVRAALDRARLFARVNPLHRGTRDEVERLLELGVQVLMLPMFTAAIEVERFTAIVGGRATVVPLLETGEAAQQIAEVVAVDGITELHVGLNDLAISLGARNRFEILFSRLVEHVADAVLAAGLRFGIGAIGRLDGPRPPIEPDLVYARYVQLGSRAALIARTYAAGSGSALELRRAIACSRERLAWWARQSEAEHHRAHAQLRSAVFSCPTW